MKFPLTMKFPLSIVLPVLLFHCVFSHTGSQIENGGVSSSPILSGERLRLEVLVEGKYCLESKAGIASRDEEPAPRENRCLQYGNNRWIPVELLSKYMVRIEDSAVATKLRELPERLRADFGPGKHHKFVYTPRSDYEDGPEGNNRLQIKIHAIKKESSLYCLSFLLLGFFPGITNEDLEVSLSVFDTNEEEHKLPSRTLYLRSYFGWYFLLWGPIASSDINDALLAGIRETSWEVQHQ